MTVEVEGVGVIVVVLVIVLVWAHDVCMDDQCVQRDFGGFQSNVVSRGMCARSDNEMDMSDEATA